MPYKNKTNYGARLKNDELVRPTHSKYDEYFSSNTEYSRVTNFEMTNKEYEG